MHAAHLHLNKARLNAGLRAVWVCMPDAGLPLADEHPHRRAYSCMRLRARKCVHVPTDAHTYLIYPPSRVASSQEEEELRRAMQQYHPHNNAEAGVPLASNLTSSNTAVGPTGLGAGGRKMVKMRSLQEATESGAPGAAILSAPPPVVSFPKPSRSGGSSRNPSPFRRATHEAGELRSSWHGVRASTGVLPQRPLDPGGVALAFPGTHPPALDAPSGLPLQPLQPHRPPPPPPTHSAAAAVAAAAPAAPTAAPPPASSPWQLVEPRHQHQHQHRHQQQPQQPQQYAFPPAAEADRQAPTTPPGALAQPDGAAGQVAPPQLTPHATSQQPGPPAAPGSPAPPFMLGALDSHSHPNTPAFATPGPPSLPLQHPLSAPPYVAAGSPPPLLRRGSGTPTAQTSASPSCSSSITFQMQPSEQHSLGGYEDGLPPRSTTTVASWNEPEEPPQQHTPGVRIRRGWQPGMERVESLRQCSREPRGRARGMCVLCYVVCVRACVSFCEGAGHGLAGPRAPGHSWVVDARGWGCNVLARGC